MEKHPEWGFAGKAILNTGLKNNKIGLLMEGDEVDPSSPGYTPPAEFSSILN